MKRLTKPKDERGAIMIMATAGVVLAVIAASLAVDLGQIAQEKRNDQKIADLAALDAARDLANVQALAVASATRNGFPTTAGHSVTAVEGIKVDGACVPTLGAGKACVTVTSPVNHAFRPGDTTVTATAMAGIVPLGGFMIGSSLATVDTTRTNLLNNFVGRMIRADQTAIGLSVLSWQGLATGNVTLEALRTELANLGFSVGTTSELLSTNMTLAQLFLASANALSNSGQVAAANALNVLRTSITNTTTLTLGEFISIAQGADDVALDSRANILQLITAAAQVANGENLISVPSVGITVPGVLTTEVKLKVIEPPRFYFGPVGGSVSTSQVELSVVTDLSLDLSILGLVGAKATGKLPVTVTGAGATGTLKAVECGAAGAGMTVTVDPTAFAGSATTDSNGITVSATVLFATVPLVRIPVTSVVPSIDGPAVDKFWAYPSQFPPPDGTMTSQHAGSQPIGLQSLTNISTGSPVVLGLLPIPVGNVTSALLGALAPLLGTIDSSVLTPLLDTLGIDIGSADTTALSMQCGTPGLLG